MHFHTGFRLWAQEARPVYGIRETHLSTDSRLVALPNSHFRFYITKIFCQLSTADYEKFLRHAGHHSSQTNTSVRRGAACWRSLRLILCSALTSWRVFKQTVWLKTVYCATVTYICFFDYITLSTLIYSLQNGPTLAAFIYSSKERANTRCWSGCFKHAALM